MPKGEMYEFTPEQIRLYQKPCVYFVYVEDEVVYIGMSKQGAARALAPHERIKTITGTYRLGFMTFDTIADAAAAETVLITSLRPRLNRYIPSEKHASEAKKALPGVS